MLLLLLLVLRGCRRCTSCRRVGSRGGWPRFCVEGMVLVRSCCARLDRMRSRCGSPDSGRHRLRRSLRSKTPQRHSQQAAVVWLQFCLRITNRSEGCEKQC